VTSRWTRSTRTSTGWTVARNRVARVVEDSAGDLVFDLTAGSCDNGSVRVMHFRIGDDDDGDNSCANFPIGVRAIVEEIPDDLTLETILDSGADASVFPMTLMDAGMPISPKGTKLCNAQGKTIPIESMRLVETRLPTSTGRSVVLKERVAISSKVSQPILCFGRLLEQGFGIDGVEQALVHGGGQVNIPLQMQNRSMTVLGHVGVRVLQAATNQEVPQMVRMVRAEVDQALINSPIGWSVNHFRYIVGMHMSMEFRESEVLLEVSCMGCKRSWELQWAPVMPCGLGVFGILLGSSTVTILTNARSL